MRRWIHRDAAEGSIADRARARPLRALTEEDVTRMVNVFAERPFTKTSIFATQHDCSVQTIRNALHRRGVHHRTPAKKLILSEQQKEIRVRFAREFRDFDFSHAIFSDEKCFKSNEHGRRHLWRVNNTRYEPRHINPNDSSGRITVNMWGWMSASGPGELVYIDGRATGQSHAVILEEVMLPTVRTVYPRDEMPSFLFFEDNCPIHRARVVQDWLRQNPEIRTVPWPSRSPDLNPIENVWGLMVQRWDFRRERNKEALIAHCNQVWDSIRGTDLCQNLVNSMRRRCDAIIDAGGAATKY